MALRNSKITSEIITNCNIINRLFASSTKLPASATLNFEPAQESIRYKISNTEKRRDLPEISFKKDVSAFQELQPSCQLEYQDPGKRANSSEVKQTSAESPFPDQLGHSFLPSVKVSDIQKAENKMLRAKALNFQSFTRNFSVTGVSYSKKNQDDCGDNNPCHAKIKPCPEKKKADCKITNVDCPKHRLANCEQSKGSNCKLTYLSPDCAKTFAPYPSYSELCAEDLPEDPSECTQCPWRGCEDADAIKPQPKKRNYSTRAYSTDVRVTPMTKPPCKPPPSPCEVRKEIEQRQKKEREEKQKKKKDCYNHEGPILDRQMGQGKSMYMNSVYNIQSPFSVSMELPETTWNYLERQTGVIQASNDRKDQSKSNSGNCKIDIKPVKDRKPQSHISMNNQMKLDTKGKGKKPLRGDEGHPPPCPPSKPAPGFNEPCPKVPLKKPKYRKKPMREAMYEDAKKNKHD